MRILFLTHRLPFPPNRGDRIRAFHLLRILRQHAEVDVLSLVHDKGEAKRADELRSIASSVQIVRVPRLRNAVRSFLRLMTRTPTTHTMLSAPKLAKTIKAMVAANPPDVVLAYCSGMARFALEPPLQHIPLVLDMVDVDSAKWNALARVTRQPKAWVYRREARLLRRFERRAVRRAFATLVTTDRERDALEALAPKARIHVIGNGVDVAGLAPAGPPSDVPTVVFCGVMNYAPNEEAAIFLARDVWPLIRHARPDARLQIVGSHPNRRVRRLAQADKTVTVTGHVTDVRPYLWSASVAAAPLLTGRGVQNKVLEAVAAGLPTIITPLVLKGLPAEVQPACIVATGAHAFANAVVGMLAVSPAERRARAEAADLSTLSWEHRLAGTLPLLTAAAESEPPATGALPH